MPNLLRKNWKLRVWSFFSFSSRDLQDFKFWCVNRRAFGASFLYWLDFMIKYASTHAMCTVFDIHFCFFTSWFLYGYHNTYLFATKALIASNRNFSFQLNFFYFFKIKSQKPKYIREENFEKPNRVMSWQITSYTQL